MLGKVLILMATYNGGRYISKQLDSIIDQSYSNWKLLISDDGSTDDTLHLITEYIKKEKRILPILHHKSDFGASSNFYYLMEEAKNVIDEYDYFFFCDQDDIWNAEKIEHQVKRLQECDGMGICYSDLMVMSADENDEYRMSSIQDIRLNKPEDIFFNQIYIWGNTLAFNKKMMSFIVIPQGNARRISHDHYVGFYGCAFGKVIYIDEPLVRYRRYESNVSDLPHKYSVKRIINRLKGIKKLINSHAGNYSGVLYFIKHAPKSTKKLEIIRRCYENGGRKALAIIRRLGVTCGANRWNSMAKKAILFTKVYKRTESFKSFNE